MLWLHIFLSSCSYNFVNIFWILDSKKASSCPPSACLQIRPFKSRWIRIHSKGDGSRRWRDLPLQKWIFLPPPLAHSLLFGSTTHVWTNISRIGQTVNDPPCLIFRIYQNMATCLSKRNLAVRFHICSLSPSCRTHIDGFYWDAVIWRDLPLKEEPGSETVDRNGKESLRLRRMDVHSDHLIESES